MTNTQTAAPGVAVEARDLFASANLNWRDLTEKEMRFSPDGDETWVAAWVGFNEGVKALRTALLAGAAGGADKGKALQDFCGFRQLQPTEREVTFFDAGYMAAHPPVPVRAPQGLLGAGWLREAEARLARACSAAWLAGKAFASKGDGWLALSQEQLARERETREHFASRLGTGALPADLCASLMAASSNILTGTAGLNDSKACATAADLLAATPPSAAAEPTWSEFRDSDKTAPTPAYSVNPPPGEAQVDAAREALRKIADLHPRHHDSLHGPRTRCQHCQYAWLNHETETHAVDCAYVIAHNALSAIASTTPPVNSGGA